MWISRKFATALLLAVAIVAPALGTEGGMDSATNGKLKEVLVGQQRSEDNRARDVYRHPADVLNFFGLRQDMTAIEIWPGGGWWTEILAPLLAEDGRYIAAAFNPESDVSYFRKTMERFKEKLTSDEAVYGKVELAVLEPGMDAIGSAAPGSADLVLSFRNMHNWMRGGMAPKMFGAMYTALKPGGYLGLVEHRAATDAPQDPEAKSGYVLEDVAVDLITNAGFELVARSEVNANPKDTSDYPKGVWTLPPTLVEGDADRAKYTAIGESDRFTLLFRKPE